MEAKELMIGDWVVRDSHKNNPVQVLELHKQSAMLKLENGWCGEAIDLIEPIPLTPEILEKNGFENNIESYGYNFEEDGEEYRFFLKKMYNKDGIHDSWGTDIGGVLPSLIFYVHELQHALRLCGLDELADNFKVCNDDVLLRREVESEKEVPTTKSLLKAFKIFNECGLIKEDLQFDPEHYIRTVVIPGWNTILENKEK